MNCLNNKFYTKCSNNKCINQKYKILRETEATKSLKIGMKLLIMLN